MAVHLLHSGRFHFHRLFRTRPRFVVAIVVSSLTLISATLAVAQQWYTLQSADEDFQLAIQQSKHTSKKLVATVSPLREALPDFDSAQLVDTLHQAAEDVKLPIDEISYALEENSSQPYLRYRVTLSVTANYPTIRKFADRFRQQASQVSLDTISCSREDITAKALNCDLGLSAFYRKAARG